MVVVAFLQNQWFKEPEKMESLQVRMGRERFVRTFLFWSCLTGKRLRKAFTEEICDEIIWEEASDKIGGKASSAYPADPVHIQAVLDKHKPDVVLTFGSIAGPALQKIKDGGATWHLISGPHPVARGAGICERLTVMAESLARRRTECAN